jgi:uncharacterized membrane protein YfcA
MLSMETYQLLLFLLLAFVAEVLGTVGGFGSSLFFVPIATFFFDFQTVLGITAFSHLSSNISKIWYFRKGFDLKLVMQIGFPAVLFVIAGASLSSYVKAEILEIALAVFLIVTSLFFLLLKRFTPRPTAFNAITGGVLSGFIAGILGTGGAIRGLTLMAFGLGTELFIATSAFIDLMIDTSRTVVYAMNGYIRAEILQPVAFLVVISFAGTYTGKKILQHISEEQFRRIVLLLILLTGLVTLFKILA